MDLGNAFSNILGQREPCPLCGELNSANDVNCSSCGASLRADDPTLSVVGGTFKRISKVPLGQAEHYVLLKRMATGIQNGTVSDAEYRVGVKKLLNLTQAAVKVLDESEMRESMKGASQVEKILKRDLHSAFLQLERGLKRMNDYSTNHNLIDVREGATLADRSFQQIDAIEDRAAQISDQK